jgi:hypothetical protein
LTYNCLLSFLTYLFCEMHVDVVGMDKSVEFSFDECKQHILKGLIFKILFCIVVLMLSS